jgi:hypothetical protein
LLLKCQCRFKAKIEFVFLHCKNGHLGIKVKNITTTTKQQKTRKEKRKKEKKRYFQINEYVTILNVYIYMKG